MEGLRLHDVVVYLVAAGLVVPVVKHWKISPVLGFLFIGLAVGPFGLGRLVDLFPWLRHVLITDVSGVRALSELGVIFLLFMIGLELSFERLWEMRRLVFGMGGLQVLVTGLAIGAIAGLFGNSMEASLLLGGCLALSSTAVVMQLLTEQGRFSTAVGRGAFAVLLAQDIAVVPILFLVGALGSAGAQSLGVGLGLAVGQAVLAIALILGVGRIIVRPVFRFVGATNSPELFMAVTFLSIIATAGATHLAGLSAALGAFLAGLLLAESEYRHEIEVNIEPFKGLLLGLFFVSIAMGIDLLQIFADPLWVVLSVIGLLALKTIVTSALARSFGFAWAESVEIGLLLAQGGEFAFVVVALALTLGLLPQDTAQFMLIVVGATMFLTPLIAGRARRLGEHMRARGGARHAEPDLAPDLSGHVIIVGCGRTGLLLADLLDQRQIAHVGLDLDAERVTRLQAEGKPVYLGDASRSAMLSKMHFERAAALAVCTDDSHATEHVLQVARRLAPNVPVVARARDIEHAQSLVTQGAARVVPELLESGLQLGCVLFEAIGLPSSVARELVGAQRIESERGLTSVVER